MPDSVTTQLERHVQRLTRCHPKRRLLARWAGDPALAGRTAADILDLCEQRTVDQNPVIAALLARHQAGDPDAGSVLLAAMQPMIKRVIAMRHPTALSRDTLDNYWAAASHLIGTIDPSTRPVRQDGQPVLFLTYLGDRVYSHLRKLDPEGRRLQDHRREGRTIVPVDLSAEGLEFARPNQATSVSAVEDAALARVELARVLRAVSDGVITADRWQRLLDHRLGTAPAPRTVSDRVAIHRTASRLASIVGHAA